MSANALPATGVHLEMPTSPQLVPGTYYDATDAGHFTAEKFDRDARSRSVISAAAELAMRGYRSLQKEGDVGAAIEQFTAAQTEVQGMGPFTTLNMASFATRALTRFGCTSMAQRSYGMDAPTVPAPEIRRQWMFAEPALEEAKRDGILLGRPAVEACIAAAVAEAVLDGGNTVEAARRVRTGRVARAYMHRIEAGTPWYDDSKERLANASQLASNKGPEGRPLTKAKRIDLALSSVFHTPPDLSGLPGITAQPARRRS